MRVVLLLLLCSPAFAAVSGCGGEGDTPQSSDAASGGPASCVPEDTAPDGSCPAAGLRACAKEFVDSDGVCRPSLERCPSGTVPKFDEGCVAAGIPGCAAPFVGDDGTCRPTQDACGPGTFAVPQKGCVSIDGPGCGAGTWGDIPDDASTVYVDAAAAPGGDGSKAAPLDTIGAALATSASVIALAAGEYAEPVAVTRDVAIKGRCASMVRISGVDDAERPYKVARVTSAKATISALTLAGPGVGLYASQADVTLDGVVVDGAREAGVLAEDGSSVTVKNSLVQNTREDLASSWSPNGGGFGLSARRKSALTITDCAVVANTTAGVHANETGTTVTARDVLVEATHHSLQDGAGFSSYDFYSDPDTAAVFDLEAVAIVGNHGHSIDLTTGSKGPPSMKIKDSLIDGRGNVSPALWILGGALDMRTTVALGSGSLALTGAYLGDHASFKVELSLLRDGPAVFYDGDVVMADTTVVATTPPALLFAPDKVGSDTPGVVHGDLRGLFISVAEKPSDPFFYGYGIYVGSDTALTVDASVVSRAHAAGILANEQATMTVTDSLVAGTEEGTFYVGHDQETAADGIVASGHASVSIDGLRVERCGRAGMLFAGGRGTVARSLSTRNMLGVVLEETKIDLTTSNVFVENGQDKVGNSDLKVPTSPAKL